MGRWAIIADDLTGALDTALQFHKVGLKTIVSSRPNVWPVDNQVTAITTETRHIDAGRAAARVRASAHARLLEAPSPIYKKTDSLLRGNVAVELRALLDSLNVATLVFSPAFPSGGRTTVDGVHKINGIPVADAEPGHDPVTPVRESHIPSLLRTNTNISASTVPLSVIRAGPNAIATAFETHRTSGTEILVPDVETDNDLKAIVTAMEATNLTAVSAGSAGLAEHLAQQCALTPLRPPRLAQSSFVAAIVGTPNRHTRTQVERVVAIAKTRLVHVHSMSALVHALAEAKSAWKSNHGVIFDATASGPSPDCGQRKEQLQVIRAMCFALASDISGLGLILTGGDTARVALEGLGVEAIEIVDEIEWGVPVGHTYGSSKLTIPIVTKGGTMGSTNALVAAFRRLQMKRFSA